MAGKLVLNGLSTEDLTHIKIWIPTPALSFQPPQGISPPLYSLLKANLLRLLGAHGRPISNANTVSSINKRDCCHEAAKK